ITSVTGQAEQLVEEVCESVRVEEWILEQLEDLAFRARLLVAVVARFRNFGKREAQTAIAVVGRCAWRCRRRTHEPAGSARAEPLRRISGRSSRTRHLERLVGSRCRWLADRTERVRHRYPRGELGEHPASFECQVPARQLRTSPQRLRQAAIETP